MRSFAGLGTNGFRPTWAWLWAFLAVALLVAGAVIITVMTTEATYFFLAIRIG